MRITKLIIIGANNIGNDVLTIPFVLDIMLLTGSIEKNGMRATQ
jgi:hypothetical protein